MTQQIIDIGSDPNDGEGDPIRVAFEKCNENFSELYDQNSGQASPGVFYVSPDGDDNNPGTTLALPFASIKAAVAAATAYTVTNSSLRSTIFVKTGTYIEDNPIQFGPRVTIVGDNLRSTIVQPQNVTQDIFQLRNACYVWGFTFSGHATPAAAIAFPTDATSLNNFITTSPYVQNCSSITTTGTGMRVDGNKAGGTKSMVSDDCTLINEGGVGVHILNQGYAQLTNIFTVCTQIGIWCETGATCSLTNSNTSFGTYGLVADGKVSYANSGFTNGVDQTGNSIVVDGLSERPNINQAISFDGGTTLYDIWNTTALISGQVTIEIGVDITTPIPDNTPVTFWVRSVITASSHTFDYVGSGTNLTTALPQNGALAIPANQVQQTNGGEVVYTSTDQRGNFQVGDQITINGTTSGTMSATGNITAGGLISLGEITGGNLTIGNIFNSNGNGVGNIGTSSTYFNTVFALTTSAVYADLAEHYESDQEYAAGTVVVFAGDKEITVTNQQADARVAGVISTSPAYLMNSQGTGLPVALRGRVPVQVIGIVRKGDSLVTSSESGYAVSVGTSLDYAQAVFAKSLETNLDAGKKIITAVIL